MLKIIDVSKKFEDLQILDHINLVVENSKIIGLAGPSGGGKTTLLRCIQRLETIDSGTIACDSVMGFMFQDFQLFPHMTVLANLMYAPTLQNKNKDHKQYAEQLLQTLGISSKAKDYPHQLSGGEKQRVALARSLMMHPDLLLCDEPTSGLDVATTLDVVALLESVRRMGITMVIASHDLDFLTKVSDNIFLLKAGRIVVSIAPKTIEDPIYYLKKYY